jgi:endogenous inhibitor of DNA gyrase (YacG/DUF329 family)
VPADTTTRTCPVCWTTFTPNPRNTAAHTYCSGRCRAEAGRRRNRDTTTPTPTPVPKPYQPEPAALRDCPHCGQPITIVALLTTPQAAQPSTTTPNLVALRAIREN